MDETPWVELEQLLVGMAGDDLADYGEVHPALAAFVDSDPVFLAFLRPFEKGCYADPLIELLALAMPLGANRYALSMGGRVWSLDDPIPPVTEEADLRQRAVVIHLVDGPSERRWGILHPFDLVDGVVSWHAPVRDLGAPEGWISEVLAVAAERPLPSPAAEIRAQAERCVALGHELHLTDPVARRLEPRRCVPRAR